MSKRFYWAKEDGWGTIICRVGSPEPFVGLAIGSIRDMSKTEIFRNGDCLKWRGFLYVDGKNDKTKSFRKKREAKDWIEKGAVA